MTQTATPTTRDYFLEWVENRGYNPYRDDKTGRFTFGTGSPRDSMAALRYELSEKAKKGMYDGGADDFISNEATHYRGETTERELPETGGDMGVGYYFTDSAWLAEKYSRGSDIVKRFVVDKSSVLSLNDRVSAHKEITRQWYNQYKADIPKKYDGADMDYDTFAKQSDSVGNFLNWVYIEANPGKVGELQDTRNRFLEKSGFTGIEYEQDSVLTVSLGKDYDASNLVMFSKDNVLDERQLTDIYNSARSTAMNSRGYNPNRDTKTGRFTFGASGKSSVFHEKAMAYSDADSFVDQNITGFVTSKSSYESWARDAGVIEEVYHGTPNEFDKFEDPESNPNQTSMYPSAGIFFSDNKSLAQEFATGTPQAVTDKRRALFKDYQESIESVYTSVKISDADLAIARKSAPNLTADDAKGLIVIAERFSGDPEFKAVAKKYADKIQSKLEAIDDKYQVADAALRADSSPKTYTVHIKGDKIVNVDDVVGFGSTRDSYLTENPDSIIHFSNADTGAYIGKEIAIRKPDNAYIINTTANEAELRRIYDEAHTKAVNEYVKNSRGYNPNRDTKTGRFTYGPKGPRQKALRDVTENESSSPSPDELYDYMDGNLPEREGDPYKSWDYDGSFEGMSAEKRNSWINEHVIQNRESDFDADIAAYVGKKDYSAINTYLRSPEYFERHPDERARLDPLIERLKRATQADTVQKPMSSYRAGIFTEEYMDNLRPGTYLQDNGIVSSSFSAIYATEFGSRRLSANNRRAEDGEAEWKGNVLFRINSQPGQKGIYADTRRTADGTEFEWIPAYGSQLHITEAVKFTDDNGRFVGGIVDVDVYQDNIPQGYVQTKLFNSLAKNASAKGSEDDDKDRFVWTDTDLEMWVPEESAENRGYNPNRDPKTGKFTWGTGKGVDGGSLGRDMTQVDTSYRGSHGAPNRDDEISSPGHNLADTFPADIYSGQAARLYGSGYPALDQQAVDIIHSVQGKPSADVTVFRAVPNKSDINEINPGDWISITRGYADMHGESNLNNEYKVLIKEVKAKDIWNNGDSIQEWGYDPSVDETEDNALEARILNSRGYNPNRDTKTGQFTFGSKAYDASTASATKYKQLVDSYKPLYKDVDDGMVYFYAGNFDNMYINGALHMQGYEKAIESFKRPMERTSDGAKAPFKEVVDGLDNIIANSPTQADMTVSRKALLNKEVIDGMISKKYLKYAGYTSTALTEAHSRFNGKDVRSLHGDVADAKVTFANLGKDERMQVFINIKVPKGSKALVVDALPNADKMLKESERELILPRDSTFSITNVKMEAADNFGYTRVEPMFFVEMELVDGR